MTTPGSVIYASWSSSSLTGAKIAIASLATGEATVLDLRGIQPLGLVDGTLLYVSSAGTIMGAPVDVAGRRLLGPPVQLVDNVVLNNSTGTGARHRLAPHALLPERHPGLPGRDGGARRLETRRPR